MAAQDADSLSERLDRTEARFAIADLIHNYTRFIRSDRPEQVPALFAEDGFFEIRDGHPDKPEFSVRGRLVGREQIGAYLTQGKGRAHPIPLVHNIIAEVNGDSATSDCVMEGQIYGASQKVFGEYRDTFRRIDGRWYFASRTFTMYSGASSV